MPQRDIPAGARGHLEEAVSPDALLAFLTIEHDGLDEPMRVVSDTLDYIYGGNLYTGIVFGFTILDDNEEAPRAEITLANVDRRIGMALREVEGIAALTLRVLSAADFDLSVVPRLPIGTPGVIYHIQHYTLTSVSVDAQQITGAIGMRDYSTEPWPCLSATQARLPGLYR